MRAKSFSWLQEQKLAKRTQMSSSLGPTTILSIRWSTDGPCCLDNQKEQQGFSTFTNTNMDSGSMFLSNLGFSWTWSLPTLPELYSIHIWRAFWRPQVASPTLRSLPVFPFLAENLRLLFLAFWKLGQPPPGHNCSSALVTFRGLVPDLWISLSMGCSIHGGVLWTETLRMPGHD